MGLFSKIFGNRIKDSSTRHDWPDEYKRVQDFNNKLALLLGSDRFIARSDYASIVSEYSELPVFFDALEKSGMLSSYAECKKQVFSLQF
jgi:DNA helicase-4